MFLALCNICQYLLSHTTSRFIYLPVSYGTQLFLPQNYGLTLALETESQIPTLKESTKDLAYCLAWNRAQKLFVGSSHRRPRGRDISPFSCSFTYYGQKSFLTSNLAFVMPSDTVECPELSVVQMTFDSWLLFDVCILGTSSLGVLTLHPRQDWLGKEGNVSSPGDKANPWCGASNQRGSRPQAVSQVLGNF